MKYGPEERALSASPAVWAGHTLYISGMTGFDPIEGIRSVDLEKQIRRMAQNDIDILARGGLKLEDIISGHVYLRDINDYTPFNDIYTEYFLEGAGGPHLPDAQFRDGEERHPGQGIVYCRHNPGSAALGTVAGAGSLGLSQNSHGTGFQPLSVCGCEPGAAPHKR